LAKDTRKRFAKNAGPPTANKSSWRDHAMAAPTVETLPFTSWGEDHWPDFLWTNVPTNNYCADRDRGKLFVQLILDAMMTDQCCEGPLEKIFESIIEDAVTRKAKRGKASEHCPPLMDTWKSWQVSSPVYAVMALHLPPADITAKAAGRTSSLHGSLLVCPAAGDADHMLGLRSQNRKVARGVPAKA
jgi:hypothetical protein